MLSGTYVAAWLFTLKPTGRPVFGSRWYTRVPFEADTGFAGGSPTTFAPGTWRVTPWRFRSFPRPVKPFRPRRPPSVHRNRVRRRRRRRRGHRARGDARRIPRRQHRSRTGQRDVISSRGEAPGLSKNRDLQPPHSPASVFFWIKTSFAPAGGASARPSRPSDSCHQAASSSSRTSCRGGSGHPCRACVPVPSLRPIRARCGGPAWRRRPGSPRSARANGSLSDRLGCPTGGAVQCRR